ncbi:hypothetical protein HK102_002116 [Quaeritorhiza haematococci]|nr:hypothetical protein HK102_002116 [Quaeritorhiza haematococci]
MDQQSPHIGAGQPPNPADVQTQSQQMQAAQALAQQQIIQAFWNNQLVSVEQSEPDFKTHALPIARIKKVMKSDEDVKSLMISAEAPMIFAKACEVFIEELTLRAWMHAEENKRRTLQKSDIATAVTKSDMYDFLIDIVPREPDMLKASSSKKQAEELYATADHAYAYYHPAAIAQFQNAAGVAPEQATIYGAYQQLQHDQLQQYHLQQQQLQYQQHIQNPNATRVGQQSYQTDSQQQQQQQAPQ